ncbi:MAG TPA: hypothetical protein VMF06_19305 [Candidatus Limnocylindria bacterium]|nr:hypothetical protein [Candidatus Limnocylindria bacterium]
MKLDSLKQYAALRKALETERATLADRLEEINEALGQFSAPAPAARTPRKYPSTKGARRGNPASLKAMVLDAIKDGPLDRKEILAAVQKAGYKFATSNPLNSLGTLLYTAKEIKNHGGTFGLK